MSPSKDRILVVENDPIISDVVGRQALKSMGYEVHIVADASAAIPQAIQFLPDVLIVDLNLPGLSGKDFLVALNSQNANTPVIVLGRRGMETDIIQAFRLGASDYMVWPVRDAEVVSVVERVLRQVRERRERERLSRQLQQTNVELQQRVRELTTIFSVGKAVISLTDQRALLDKIIEGAARVTQADSGWMLMWDEASKKYVMAAQRNLPGSLVAYLNQPWDDGISSLVAMSGEPLSIFGDPLKRFKISSLGQAALIVPVKVKKQVIGLLVVIRKAAKPFAPSEQNLLEAVSDYASISLVNARLFRAVEERAHSLQQNVDEAHTREKIKTELLQQVSRELNAPIHSALTLSKRLSEKKLGQTLPDSQQVITAIQSQLQDLLKVADAIYLQTDSTRPGSTANLNQVAQQALKQMQRFAQQNNLTITSELPSETVTAQADPSLVEQVVIGLLSNAIKYTPSGGQINLLVCRSSDNLAQLTVQDNGPGLQARFLSRIFESGAQAETQQSPQRFGGLGISLPLMKEIVTAQGGKIWAESKTGQGAAFHVTFTSAK